MTLTAKPPSFTNYHRNLLLWLAIYHRHLSVRHLNDLLYISGELVFPEGDLLRYCGRLLTRLKEKPNKVLILRLQEGFDPSKDFIEHKRLTSSPCPQAHPPSPQQQSTQYKELNMSRNKSRSPQRPKSTTKLPKEPTADGDLAFGISGMNLSTSSSLTYAGDEPIRRHGNHTIRCYRGTATNKQADPDFSVEFIKMRLSLTQSNLLAAGDRNQLIRKTSAVMKHFGSTKRSGKIPTVVISVPGCDVDYTLAIAKRVQKWEDHKFDMHCPQVHQQEHADIISAMNRSEISTPDYMTKHVVELPLFKEDGDKYEDINKDFFNGTATSDECSLMPTFSFPNPIEREVAAGVKRDIPIGFVAFCVCVKGPYCDLKAKKVGDDEDFNEFEYAQNNFFDGGDEGDEGAEEEGMGIGYY